MSQLEILRESLGQCDEIILDALLMRNRIVEDIMAYKKSNDLPILQPEQEAKQKEWLEKRMEKKRHKAEVEDVFGSITMNSKRIQSRKLFNYNIVLIGFMGSGKSTISEFLKNSFAMEVIEMDQIIAEREGGPDGEQHRKDDHGQRGYRGNGEAGDPAGDVGRPGGDI